MVARFPILRSICLSVVAVGLTNCDSPSPGFAGLPRQEVTIDGSRFSVYHSPYQAQAIRTNPEWPPRRAQIMAKAEKAIAAVSGCAVVPGSLKGDAALVKADLKCPGAAEERRPPKRFALDCDVTQVGRTAGYGPTEIDCGVVEL